MIGHGSIREKQWAVTFLWIGGRKRNDPEMADPDVGN